MNSSDFVGIHNENLEATSQRLVESGTWKRQNVVMVIPAGKSINTKVYLSHCSLMFPPNQAVYRMTTVNKEVGEAFTEAFEFVLSNPDLNTWSWILTIEHDNLPPPDGLLKLIKHMEAHPEFSAIGGLYFCKGEEGCAQVWGNPHDEIPNFRPQPPRTDGGLQECVGLGMGFTLFRTSMFKDTRLRRPFFKTQADSSGCATQDLFFWGDARKYGYRCAVATDVRVGHMDLQTEIIW